jgi:alpha-beta hydrolase superfamily lysophospholipase
MNEHKFLDRAGEPRLAYDITTPDGEPRGRVLMVHGYAEHSARYDRVVAVFREHGLAVARFDLRGHGRSGGLRGHVASFDDYVRDVGALLGDLERAPSWKGGAKPMLFGHSLGGLISTHYALSHGAGLQGLALTSPFYGLALHVPKVQLVLGKLVSRVAPTLKQPSRLQGSDLTHDAALASTYDHDPHHFDHVTVGWFEQVRQAQEILQTRAAELTLPVFCIAAGDDRVVSVPAVRRVFDAFRSTDKELDVRTGLFHEVLNELDWRDHAVRLAERMVRWTGG